MWRTWPPENSSTGPASNSAADAARRGHRYAATQAVRPAAAAARPPKNVRLSTLTILPSCPRTPRAAVLEQAVTQALAEATRSAGGGAVVRRGRGVTGGT